MSKSKLTSRQKKFVQEYIKLNNATQAAKNVGYSEKTAKQQGSRLLTNVDVEKEIKRLQKKLEDEFSYSIYKSFQNLEKIQKVIIGEESEKDIKTLKENPQLISQFIKSEELKGKLTGLYTEKHVHTGDIVVNHMGTVKVGGKSINLNIGESPDANTGVGTS